MEYGVSDLKISDASDWSDEEMVMIMGVFIDASERGSFVSRGSHRDADCFLHHA